MIRALFCTSLLLIAPATLGQTADDTVIPSNPLLAGWTPDVSRLQHLRGEAISNAYADLTVKGVYSNVWQREQRFVEHHTAEGRVSYREGDFTAKGDWSIEGDVMCFQYDGIPDAKYCYTVFRYGACLITFSDEARVMRGLPLNPEYWHSVQLSVEPDFRWPDRPPEEDDAFACEAFIS